MNLIGKTLGNYEIDSEIGKGGMGTVYRAHQSSLNRYVAIKVLAPNLAHDSDFLKRFKQEAVATAQLDHPNVIHVYDTGEAEGMPYMVIEYLAGGNLATRLKAYGNSLPIPEAVSIASQIAMALDFAHRHNIIHRDVKPSNILFDGEGRAVLSDLGISRAFEGTRLTQTGITMGTPEYMSPEQAEGKEIDGRADLYSLAVVLYEMLTAKTPYQGETPLAVLYKQVHAPVPDARKLNAAVPKKLVGVLERGLAKEPQNRFATGQHMAEALQACVPGAKLYTTPASATIQTPTGSKELAVKTLDTARRVSVGSARALGRFTLRILQLTLEAFLVIAVVLVIAAVAVAIGLSFFIANFAQSTLRDYPWEYSVLYPPQPYLLTANEFTKFATPFLENRTARAIRSANLTFAPPSQVHFFAYVLDNPVSLEGSVYAQNDVPQLRLERLNNLPLPFVGDIISNGINQGMVEGWRNAPVRVKNFTATDKELRMEIQAK